MIRLEINKRFAKIITILGIGLVLFLFNTDLVSANTGINPQIPYSGNIIKNDGTILSDGTYRAKFLLYNVVSGGTAIYEEVRDGNTSYAGTGVSPALTVSDGRFEILLGSQNTTNFTSILNDDSLWLELQLDINNDSVYEEIFTPRRRLGSALYAINSMRLVAANGGTDVDTLSLDVAGNVVASSLGGDALTSIPTNPTNPFNRVIIANGSGQFSQVSLNSIGSGWGLTGNAGTSASTNFIGTTDAVDFVARTNNVERMRITAAGNVGIGTTSPSGLLHLSSTTIAETFISATGAGGRTWRIGTGDTSSGLGGAFRIYDQTGTAERVRITSTGNVGIGTASPDAKLVVAGDSTGTAKIGGISSGGNYTGISLNGTLNGSNYHLLSAPDDPNLYINRPSSRDIRFLENNSLQAIIRTGGNVGIGTANPGSLLQVNGGVAIGYSASTAAPTNGLLVSGMITPSVGTSNGIDWPNDPFGGGGDDAWIRYYSDNGAEDMKLQIGTSNDGQDDIDFVQSGASRLSIEMGHVSIPNGNFGVSNRIGAGIAAVSTTARLHIGAGTATANTAPIKFTAGTNLTTPEAGAMEWDGTNLFLTNSSNTRQTINQGLTSTATLDFPSTNNNSFNNLTVTVTGAVAGDVVTLGLPNGSVPAAASNFTAWVSAANTVTVRFSNHSGVAQDPASGSFKVFVTKF